MRARAARARRLLDAAQEAAALKAAFRRMAAVEAQPVERMVGEIDAKARGLLELQRLLASIFEPHGTREHAVSRKDGIGEHCREAPARITQRDLKRLRLILPRVERGQPCKRRLAAQNAIAIVKEVNDIRPIRQRDAQRRDAEIPMPLQRELLRQHVERKRALILVVARLRRKRAVESRELRAAAECAQRSSPVAVQKIAPARDRKHIAETVVLQVKYLLLLVK